MKVYKNQIFKSVKAEDIRTFDDIALLMESASKTYNDLLHQHFEYQKMCEDGILKEVYPTIETIAEKVGCSEKTVDRFNADFSAAVFHRRRYRNGKQTSNLYKMNKVVYQYMKAFWRLGLWKAGNNFKFWWEWIKKMWQECGCDHFAFMNKVWNHKPYSSKKIDGSSEQAAKKMSLSNLDKCPSSSNPLSEMIDICTGWVPSSEIKKMERLLLSKARDAVNDMKWFSIEQRNKIRSYPGLFADMMRRNLASRKV